MPQLRINAIDHRYTIDGPANAPVVTFGHAQGFNLESWAAQVAALRARYRVLALDFRGHGGSDLSPVPYRIEDLAGDIIGLLDALGIATTHYVGASLGGMAGFSLALDHANRLDSVTFVTTQGVLPQSSAQGQRANTQVMRRDGMGARADAVLARYLRPGFRDSEPDRYAVLRRQFAATPVAGYAVSGDAIFAMGFDDRIAGITLPTMIIAGEKDIATTPQRMTLYRDNIAGAQMAVIADAGHMPYVEQAGDFNAALAGFLDAQPQASA
jgi:3-oxoadipate enol-lactonase